MKKRVIVCVAFIIASVLTSGIFGEQTIYAATDNFTITNFAVDMELGHDSDGRSTLRTIETITANFPLTDENHGLERIMVKSYDGHKTNFKLDSVTDENNKNLPYHWEGDALRIGDADTYVHGLNTYKITYTQRDVTKQYADTNKDEFYWDAIGVEWRVPIERASVRLTVAPELRPETNLQCYIGALGSTERCQANEADGVYTLSAENIGNYSGITVALGFTPGTFAPYQMSLFEQLVRLWFGLLVITSLLGFIVIFWLSIKAYSFKYRESEIGTIVPEYIPPKDASIISSAAVTPGYHPTLAAQLTDLAVRHYVQILETKPKKSFWQPAEYDIKVIRNISDLRAEEQEILSDMFGHAPETGERLALKTLQNNTSAYIRFSDNDKKLQQLLRNQYDLEYKNEDKRAWFSKVAKVLLVLSVVTLSPLLFVAWVIAFIISKTLWTLSDEGLALRRYLKGLELYIKVAEKDRLKMLQSPEGAEKVDIKDPTKPAQLVKLYERVLPYAVLFGQEKEWSKRLGEYYARTNSSPDWYTGNTAFNAVVFSSMMSNFSTAVSTTSASSSSTGGSSGGGSSGGGGGGGGGGGW